MFVRHLIHIALGILMIPLAVSCDHTKSTAPAGTQDPSGRTDVKTATAIFAGGCFWGVDHWFRQVPGVISVTSGYGGGATANPTYEEICSGQTGHAESVRVVFDPVKVSYEQLARLFFEIHDPTTLNSQGPDFGTQYRSVVFYDGSRQKAVVEKLIGELRANGYQVVTEVLPAGPFYPADEYHQDYLDKHPGRTDCHVRVDRFHIRKR
jgi:peptide methionine sulfoxide reductase msrA/msrB